jgi:hypothetical protein
MAQDAPGMKGYRLRNDDGHLRAKRADTHVESIEKKYDVDLGVRGDTHLGNLLKEKGVASLDALLNDK